MATMPRTHFTVGELGDVLGVQAWRISRLFELGLIPEPQRVGGRRLISQAMVGNIVTALRDRGWLPTPTDLPAEAVGA